MSTVERIRSGSPHIGAFRISEPPVGAPTDTTARGVWELVDGRLVDVPGNKNDGDARTRVIEDIAGSILRHAAHTAERAEITLVAQQALTVAIDTMVAAGRDRRAVFINTVFDALAQRWSPTYRATLGDSWEKLPGTLRKARSEMLLAGADLARVWTAVADGIAGLYTVEMIRGKGHARGRRVRLVEGEPLDAFVALVVKDPTYVTVERNRVLPANAPTPPRTIDQKIIGERAYDVVTVGEPTEKVLQILEGARVFVDLARVAEAADKLEADVAAHPWPGMLADWKRENAIPKGAEAADEWLYKNLTRYGTTAKAAVARVARKDGGAKDMFALMERLYVQQHRDLADEYGSLCGRRVQVQSILRQAARHGNGAMLEIRTMYKKVRNRRFQPLHFWPAEVTTKRGEVTRDLRGEETAAFTLYAMDFASYEVQATPRGDWFRVRAFGPDEPAIRTAADGAVEHDDFAGPLRPLVGADVSSSMYQVMAALLGYPDLEAYMRQHDLKDLIVREMRAADRGRDNLLAGVSDKQMRTAAGKIANQAYGQTLPGLIKDLRTSALDFGDAWRGVDLAYLQRLLDDMADNDAIVRAVHRMRAEWLEVTRELAEAARAADPNGGIVLTDPFDGQQYVRNAPLVDAVELSNGGVPLQTKVPLGDGAPNWNGALVPVRVRKGGKWVDAVKKDGTPRMKRVDTKGSIYTALAPCLIHAADAAFASHAALKLHEAGVRDLVIVHDCFLAPSDAFPTLNNALVAASRAWFEQSVPRFFEPFDRYLPGHPVVARWKTTYEHRLAALRGGSTTAFWPDFNTKREHTVTAPRVIREEEELNHAALLHD